MKYSTTTTLALLLSNSVVDAHGFDDSTEHCTCASFEECKDQWTEIGDPKDDTFKAEVGEDIKVCGDESNRVYSTDGTGWDCTYVNKRYKPTLSLAELS